MFVVGLLAALASGLVDKHPEPGSSDIGGAHVGSTDRGGLPAMFFEEVKRTEGSHDEKNRRRSPPALD